MTKTIISILGGVFLVLGLVGFAVPGLMGTHLSTAHNLVHLVTGAVTLILAQTLPVKSVKIFALVFGTVYGLLGVAGLFAGPGVSSVPHLGHDDHLLVIIPQVLELGTMDSILHVLVGIAFLALGLLPEPQANIPEPSVKMPDKEVASFKG